MEKISFADRMRSEEVFHRGREERRGA